MNDREAITHRWKVHYEELLNRDTTPEFEALVQLPHLPITERMGEPPSLEEVQDAIRTMKNNKATGPDGIPAEVLKEGGPVLLEHIHSLLLKIWEKEEIPAQLNFLSLWIPPKQRHYGCDLCCAAVVRKVPGTESTFQHGLHRPHQSL